MNTRRAFRQIAFCLIVCLLIVPRSPASEMLETDDFQVVRTKAIELGKQFGNKNVLLVFDIDNTLLAMNQELGSDQWFNWQRALLDKKTDSPHRVAGDFAGLVRASRLLFALSRMYPPQSETPGIVVDLQKQGFPTLLLTSRDYGCRDATHRVMKENRYDFAKSALRVPDRWKGLYLPYDPDDVEASGISAGEAKRFGLRDPGEVSYEEGILMTAGQHKGAMLRMILARSGRRFSAVIFVDDHEKNTRRVFEAMAGRGIEVLTYRYGREDEKVERFHQGDKWAVTKQWKDLQETLQAVFR